MRKFLSLPQEKQNRIVEAAMTLFGDVGYKKAYISEIAAAARISKALVFHYFGSKKDLYSYLVYYAGKIVMTEAQEKRVTDNKNFFDRVIITTQFRLSIKNRYPAMNTFIESVYKEDEPEVAADVQRLLSIAGDMHSNVTFSPAETEKLKDGIDPKLMEDLMEKYMDGVVAGWNDDLSIDETIHKVTKCLNMLNRNLCK